MAHVNTGRKTTTNDREIVVFLIGAKINKWWLLPFSLPLLVKMRKMQQELLKDPSSGLLGIQSLGGADVQYWRSVDDLMRYAFDKTKEHQPTMKKFFQKVFKNAAFGIWHETYVVPAGNYENIYTNMPAFGLGKVNVLVEATGELATARGRLSRAEVRAA